MCADLGAHATGVDLSSAALRAAEAKARDRGLTARFLRQDARKLADLGESFDKVSTAGCSTASTTTTASPTSTACGP
jgi:cyclopropane fatty-acyl-phospholipid synthase-like methyltransferase